MNIYIKYVLYCIVTYSTVLDLYMNTVVTYCTRSGWHVDIVCPCLCPYFMKFVHISYRYIQCFCPYSYFHTFCSPSLWGCETFLHTLIQNDPCMKYFTCTQNEKTVPVYQKTVPVYQKTVLIFWAPCGATRSSWHTPTPIQNEPQGTTNCIHIVLYMYKVINHKFCSKQYYCIHTQSYSKFTYRYRVQVLKMSWTHPKMSFTYVQNE